VFTKNDIKKIILMALVIFIFTVGSYGLIFPYLITSGNSFLIAIGVISVLSLIPAIIMFLFHRLLVLVFMK
jgi:hypothetical protein